MAMRTKIRIILIYYSGDKMEKWTICLYKGETREDHKEENKESTRVHIMSGSTDQKNNNLD